MKQQIKSLTRDWKIVKISEVCEVISGSTPKTNVKGYWGGDIPWITPKDLSKYTNKYIEKTERTITREGYESCSTMLIPENNVLMSSRAPIGYLVVNKVPMCTNQGFKSFKIKDRSKLNEEFLYYYLKFIVEKIKKEGSGTTFNELSKTKAESIELILPSFQEQIELVSEIEKQFTRLDAAIKSLNAVKEKLEIYRKVALKKAFEKKEGWEEEKLEKICEKITDGAHYTPKYVSSGFPFLSVKNRKNGKLNFENINLISEEDFMKLKNNDCNPKMGDVLFSKDGTVGEVININYEREFIVLSSWAILRPKEIVTQDYLFWLMKSPLVFNQAINLKTGTAIRRIILRNLKNVNVNFPKRIEEQQQIVSEIESRFSVIDKVEQVVEASLEKAEKLRKSLLKSAFEGKLVNFEEVKQ